MNSKKQVCTSQNTHVFGRLAGVTGAGFSDQSETPKTSDDTMDVWKGTWRILSLQTEKQKNKKAVCKNGPESGMHTLYHKE